MSRYAQNVVPQIFSGTMAGRDFSSTDGVYPLRVALGSHVSLPLDLSHKLVWFIAPPATIFFPNVSWVGAIVTKPFCCKEFPPFRDCVECWARISPVVLVTEQAVGVFLAKVMTFFSLCLRLIFIIVFGLAALEPCLDRIDQLFHVPIFPPLVCPH